MSTRLANVLKLKAGEHYGPVIDKRRTKTAIFSETFCPEGMDLPAHSHELAFFTFVVDGCYSEILGHKTVFYPSRTVLWRRAGLTHKDKVEAAGSRFFFIEIDRTFAARISEGRRVPEHMAECNSHLTWLASRLRSEIVAGDVSSPLIAEGLTLEMLGHLTRGRPTAGRRPPKWLNSVVERLNDQFTEDLTSVELSRDANVHPVYLATVFRRFYNESVGEYVQKLRVARALDMLRDTDVPLCDIAYSCGFSDQSHFSRIFKRRVGITPGAFRQR